MPTYRYTINPRYQHLTDWLHRLPSEYDTTGRLIYDKRNKVRLYTIDGQQVVVKRFKQPMIHQRIDYTCIRPSKARRAYTFALRLLTIGIDTPEPIACIEAYSGGLFRQGYFVSAYTADPDCRHLREQVEGNEPLIRSLAQFIAQMHAKGFLHGDINLSNILYRTNADGTYHFSVIDINRSHFTQSPTRRQCLRNLVRLTHQRPTMAAIVSAYATIRGWDADRCVADMMSLLDDFEHSRLSWRTLRRMFR